MKETGITSYRKTLDHLKTFCASRRILYLSSLDLAALTDFRAGRSVPPRREGEAPRPISPATSAKELEALRTFCAFAVKREWMDGNCAKELRAPREDGPSTMPYTADEVSKILAACDSWGDRNPNTRELTRANARAMVLVMLYSGLRISDTVQLRRDAVDLTTGKMLLRIMKTGRKQYVRLGQPAIDAQAQLHEKGEYFFRNGNSALKTATGLAWRTISRLLARAGVKGHPHHTGSGIPSRSACSKRASNSEQCNSCSATTRSRRQKNITLRGSIPFRRPSTPLQRSWTLATLRPKILVQNLVQFEKEALSCLK